MKVIIVGAGDVGLVSAQTISDVHDVMVIEHDEDIADALKSRLNVSILREDGTNPRVLEYAIRTHDADIVLSTLKSDPENLFVCMMAKRLKPTIRTVATVTNPDYLIETSDDDIDHIISPHLVTAQKMYRLCVLENLVEFEPVRSMGVCIAVFKVETQHPIVGRIVMHLPLPEDCTIFGIYRDDEMFTAPETMEIHAGDRICLFGTEEAATEFNDLVGVEEVSREFCILGGAIVGENLARQLSNDPKKRYVKMIETDPERCKFLARQLAGVTVINADYTDPDILFDENVFRMDATISTSGRDETNLLMCMSAKKQGAKKVIARFFMREYEDVFKYTGLNTIIGFDRIVTNEVLKCIVPDETAICRMQSSDGLFFTHHVNDLSRIRGRYVGDLNLPKGLRIVAIRRNGAMHYPRLDTMLTEGDSAVMFADGLKESEIVKALGRGTIIGM